MRWLLYPGWQAGVMMDLIRFGSPAVPRLAARYDLLHPDTLPGPSSLRGAADLHDLTDRSTSDYTFIVEDVSGMSLRSFVIDKEVHVARATSMPRFNHLSENACGMAGSRHEHTSNELDTRGPLHPRTFLLLYYRPDALEAMAEVGLAPDGAAPPSDWEGMLRLLEAHASAVAAQAQQAEQAQQGHTSAAGAPLPRHGLCLTADPVCGRVGDVLMAIAASVLQTQGTGQGYAMDLSSEPPAIASTINGTGWRYAASVLQQLLSYNAPEPEPEPAADGGAPAPTCFSASPAFRSGDCLMTLEWDAAMTLVASAPAMRRPGVLGVAPLPGSLLVQPPSGWVPDAASAAVLARTAGRDWTPGELVPCSLELCATSVNHDLLYLQPTIQGAEAAAAAAPEGEAQQAASGGGGTGEAVETDGSLLEVFKAREAAAAARLRVMAAPAVAEPPLVNRAPYSAAFDQVLSVRFLGSGVDASSLGDVLGLQQWILRAMDGWRASRQNATDGLRATLGFHSNVNSDVQDCHGYASADWWRVLAPSRGRTNASGSTGSSGGANSSSASAGWAADARALASAAWIFDLEGSGVSYYRALWHAVHSPNAAPDMQSPVHLNWFKYAAGWAAQSLMPPSSNNATSPANTSATGANAAWVGAGGGVGEAMALLDTIVRFTVESFGSANVRETYEDAISAPAWQPLAQGPPTLAAADLAAIGVSLSAAGVMAVLAAALALLALRRRRRLRHRDLLGRVLAPRAGPDTTLLITDVQNSTVLWEGLPVQVMDVVLKLHHSVVRAVLHEHDGYESATEGDSFIVAFATPAAALAFATACQVALLKQDWPAELLQHPDGAPVLVASPFDPRAGDSRSTAVLASLGFVASRNRNDRHLLNAGVALRERRNLSAGNTFFDKSGGAANAAATDLLGTPPAKRFSLWGGMGGSSRNTHKCSSAGEPPAGAGAGAGPNGSCRCAMPDGPNSAEPAPRAPSRLEYPVLPAALGLLQPSGAGPAEEPHPPTSAWTNLSGYGIGNQHCAARKTRFSLDSAAGPPPLPLPPPPPPLLSTGSFVGAISVGALGGGPVSALGGGPVSALGGGPVSGAAAAAPLSRALSWKGARGVLGGLLLSGDCGSDSGRPKGPASSSGMTTLVQSLEGFDMGPADMRASWGEVLAAAFPVQSLDTPEGRRLAALVGPDAADHDDDGGLLVTEDGSLAGGAGGAAGAAWREPPMRWDTGGEVPVLRLPDGRLALVAYRGLRVRMGMHTGLDKPEHVAFNKVASAYAYKGPFAEVAKLVSDAAPGGGITLSAAAFSRLRNTRAPAPGAKPGETRPPAAAVPTPNAAAAAAAAGRRRADSAGSLTLSGSRLIRGVRRLWSGSGLLHSPLTSVSVVGSSPALHAPVVVYAGRHVLTEPKPQRPAPRSAARVARFAALLGAAEPQPAGTGAGVGRQETGAAAAVSRFLAPPSAVAEQGEDSGEGCRRPHGSHGSRLVTADGITIGIEVGAAQSGSLAPSSTLQASGTASGGVGGAAAVGCSAAGGGGGGGDRPVCPACEEGCGGGATVFLAVHPSLVCRLALSPPLRVVRTVALGSLAAPVRHVTVVFMKVVGASTLIADLPGPACRALGQFQCLGAGLLAGAGGYLVEGADGLLLAAFGSPGAAVEWALECVAALRQQTWEEELLAHEMCAPEVSIANVPSGESPGDGSPKGPVGGPGEATRSATLRGSGSLMRHASSLHCGLRIKVGLDIGTTAHTLTEASGRLSYRGKPMNRAARIAAIAAAGQVLVSADVWEASAEADPGFMERVVGTSLGPMALKGVTQPVEVIQVHSVMG
ncbi:hypothetical protein GPECTOR_15g373 [Gonium pectorale]|uniref:Guanylate cyclase domain-containing protein n=1 Tax=Gonium pectorale TaxID=33097 RepID=A0A150GLF9_GONPE|nr:hypothetical protein GPECTOR_15g373 [Gonium pectorale]|eukprot:KXZ50689.1 hypothetical protein GPECTOR_15g373 [Gonium pectorale]